MEEEEEEKEVIEEEEEEDKEKIEEMKGEHDFDSIFNGKIG